MNGQAGDAARETVVGVALFWVLAFCVACWVGMIWLAEWLISVA